MKDYIIRLAVEDDLKRVQELSQELMEHEKRLATKEYMFNMDWALTEEGYENYKSNISRDELYVVCVDNKIVGYMTCWVNRRMPWQAHKTMEVGNLFVEEEYRNMGIGTALINKAKTLCKEKEIRFLKIEVTADNEKAQSFYKKNGLYASSIEQYYEV
ncbi:MAG: GNAT family N-acetyltransferase [Clostridia bacterium]|nr:GNAT family N-acetyltransferase [Clostridia bacterium]